MKRRRRVVVMVVVAAVVAGLGAAYLTGFIVIGDRFAGTWSAGNPDAKLVIRHTDKGYSSTNVLGGQYSDGWWPLKRTGRNTLGYEGRVWEDGKPTRQVIRFRFVFQPWSRHLVAHYDG